MIKRLIVLLLLAILPLLYGCGKNPSFNALDPTLLWDTGPADQQTVITPASGTRHAWSGLNIKKEFFIPNKSIAKFILWQDKAGKTPLAIEYLLKGRKADVFINSIKTLKLNPRYRLKASIQPMSLVKGPNFIEFRLKGKTELKIKSLRTGNQAGATPEHHIPAGRTIRRFYPKGSGKITFSGKGQIKIRRVEFIDGKTGKAEDILEAGFLSGDKTYDFTFQGPGFLQFTCLEGNFDFEDMTFSAAKKAAVKKTILKNKQGVPGKPHIFIFLIDGCHADHLGLAGYRRDTTPNVDRLAKDGVIFDNAYANATFTRSSVATIFTGFFPHRHKLRILTNRLPKGLFMLPEFMKKIGYGTALLTEAGNISEFFGFSQGVDNYRKVFRRWDDPRYLENNTFKFFSEWIKTEGPLFTYVHYRAPHFPIVPPPPFLDMYKEKKQGQNADRLIFRLKKMAEAGHTFTPEEQKDIIDDYDSAIRYVDDEVGKLIATLKKEGIYDSSLIIFTSDHGEALYEHGYWGHGQTVYDEASRVPLVVKFPGHMKLKGRVKRVVQLADIFPTIAELFGKERYFDGQSLLESIVHKELDDTFAVSTSFGTPPTLGFRWRNWFYIKYMHDNSEELFNLDKDPKKDVSGLEENKDLVIFFRAKFLHWLYPFDNLERTSQSVDLKKLPKYEYENLKSLGYIN